MSDLAPWTAFALTGDFGRIHLGGGGDPFRAAWELLVVLGW